MNADRLLEVYEQISEAPDAVARLRRFVLDLAVRGKLVEQDAGDEPASELMRRAKSLKGEEGVKTKADPIQGDDIPFPAPRGWIWTRVGEIALQTGSGSTPRGGKSAYSDDGTPFLRSQNIYDDGLRLDDVVFINDETNEKMKRTQVKPKDLLLNITGGSIGRCSRTPDEFSGANVSQHVAIIRTAAANTEDYLHLLVRSPFFQEYVLGEQTGAGRGGLPKNRMDRIPVPLPPLAEQHRIVAKVDELMALCDRLEEARKTREEMRDKLTAASLARLTAPDTTPEDFPAHARFALNSLPALTSRPDQIKTLRQTILNLAVRGKLVEQDPAEAEGLRIEINLPDSVLRPFEIPTSWQWVRLRSLGAMKGGGTPSKSRDDFWNGSIPWVSPKDMKVDYISSAQLSITDAAISGSSVNLLPTESILFVVRGMILAHSFPVAISRAPLAINQDMKAIVLKDPRQSEYVLRALWGMKPEMLERVQRSSHGTCRIEGKDYSDFLIPIPPLAEQHRIVAKVDALMALCDRLEAALREADTTRTRLLESLLHEALEPATGALEAAE